MQGERISTTSAGVHPPEPPVGPPVLPTGPLQLQFCHKTIDGVSEEVDNIVFPGYWTRLEHPALDNHPEAVITITPLAYIVVDEQAHKSTIVHNPHAVGVIYSPVADDHWYIYNLGLESMSVNAFFNVAINQEADAE